jgi:hypothetical protein
VQSEIAPAINATETALNETAEESLNATSLNETSPAINETLPVLNETMPVINETQPVLNETAPAANETETALNQTAPAINETASTNASANAAPTSGVFGTAESTERQVKQIGSTENQVFVIGGKTNSNEAFHINSESDPGKTLEVGTPIKAVRDLSGMFFSCNII